MSVHSKSYLKGISKDMELAHKDALSYLSNLQYRLEWLPEKPELFSAKNILRREIGRAEAQVARIEEEMGVEHKAIFASGKPEPPRFTVFQDSPVTSTTIDIGIDVFTLALLFPILQTTEGQRLVKEILAKAVPEGCVLAEEAVLQKVESRNNIMRFELVAEHKMLAVPNPRMMPAHQDFSLDVSTRELRPSHDLAGTFQTNKQTFQDVYNNMLNATTQSMSTSGMPYYSPITTASGTGTPVQGVGHIAAAIPYAPYSTVDEPEEREYGTALDLLDAPGTAVSNDLYLVYRTNLDSYHLYQTKGGTTDEPGEKLYVASDLDDLKEEVRRLCNAAEQECFRTGEEYNFACDLQEDDWYLI